GPGRAHPPAPGHRAAARGRRPPGGRRAPDPLGRRLAHGRGRHGVLRRARHGRAPARRLQPATGRRPRPRGAAGRARGAPRPPRPGVGAVGRPRPAAGRPRDDAGPCSLPPLGCTARRRDVCSRLRVADLDPEQQRAWIEEAPARRAGYRTVGWVGEVPDEWLEPLARAFDAMSDAPLGDVEWRIPPIDGARVREDVRAWDAQGYDVAHTLALAPDGSPAGATALAVSRLRPAIGRQSDTGVLRDHRGLGLGRWLK